LVCLGSGFDAAAQVGCPALVPTTYISATELHATIPADLNGAPGTSLVIGVYVALVGGTQSNILPFTVLFPFPVAQLQAWTTVESVCSEVPGFQRNQEIGDAVIENWIKNSALEICGALMKRGLSLNPADWAQPSAQTGWMSPISLLEHINGHGAALHLAAWVAARFSGDKEWPLAAALRKMYADELASLANGAYDKLFRPGAVTVETGVQVSGGDVFTSQGDADQAFRKDQVF
jgi:hypothetical protein